MNIKKVLKFLQSTEVLMLFISIILLTILTGYSIENLNLKEELESFKYQVNSLQDTVKIQDNIIVEKNKELILFEGEINNLKTKQVEFVGTFKITYYCACEDCCGKTNGITASGIKVQEGVTVAADTSILPFGTKIYIQGIGERIVQDRGGAIKGNIIDVYVSSHEQIPSVGTHYTNVWLVIN